MMFIKAFNVFFIFHFICMALAGTTTSKTTTLVWATGTDENGNTQTTQSAYTQTFLSFYSDIASPESGEIGLGSLSGSVGGIKTYDRTTISQVNAGSSSSKNRNLFSKINTSTKALIVIPALAIGSVIFM